MVFVCLNQKNLPIELQDKKLLLNLMQRFSEINTYNEPDMNVIDKKRYFDYPVEAFAELLGWKYNEENRRNVVKELKKSIYHLDSYRLVATDVAIKKAKDKRITKEEFQTIPILGGVTLQRITEEALSEAGTENKEKKPLKVEKGCIRISLSMELAKYLNIAPIAYYPPELKQTKNPVSFYIGYDLITHFNTNEICHHFKNGKVRKISAILEKCKDLPSYEHIKNTSRKYYEYIMKPFCTALAELKSFDIEICSKNDSGEYEPINSLFLNLKEGIFDYFKGYNFENFLNLYIVFSPINYPDKVLLEDKKLQKVCKSDAENNEK